MSKKDVLKEMYMEARQVTGCTQKEWATIFNLGVKTSNQNVSSKETGTRGVNTPEALASQLLMFLDSNGYDIKRLVFNKSGYLEELPKKVTS